MFYIEFYLARKGDKLSLHLKKWEKVVNVLQPEQALCKIKFTIIVKKPCGDVLVSGCAQACVV